MYNQFNVFFVVAILMFKKELCNQPLIDFPEVRVLYTGRWGEKLNPTTSLVCFSVNGCKILMASRQFKQSEAKVTKNKLYETLGIVLNCDLSQMEHGTAKDVPNLNMPIFHKWADNINTCLQENKGKSVLINCHNGRSRTGTVVALYLMKYHKFSSHDAMSIVNSVLRIRGITKDSINVETINLHGNYGDWLRRWENENKKQFSEQKADNSKTPSKKRTLSLLENTTILTSNVVESSLVISKKIKINTPKQTLISEYNTVNSQLFFKKGNLNLTVDSSIQGQCGLGL
jgi:hypothetical protein